MTKLTGNDALFTLGARPFVFDIDYTGTATSAEIYVQTFKQGKLIKPYFAVGGCIFVPPVRNLKTKIYVTIFDSKTSVMKLNTQEHIEGDFFRFKSDMKDANGEVGGGSTVVPANEMEISGFECWNGVYSGSSDLSKDYIPIGVIKSNPTGGGMSVPADLPSTQSELSSDNKECNYVVFYLRLNRTASPSLPSGSH